ncbi:MAG: hypothetical protein Q4C82_10505, partial [Eubacteriales bacterium]|nr:hypothetical protein [Eubacteriales bacterium]
PFSFKHSTRVDLSYKVKKNPATQASPPAAGRLSDMIPIRRSAIPRSVFLCNRKFGGISCCIKKDFQPQIRGLTVLFLYGYREKA